MTDTLSAITVYGYCIPVVDKYQVTLPAQSLIQSTEFSNRLMIIVTPDSTIHVSMVHAHQCIHNNYSQQLAGSVLSALLQEEGGNMTLIDALSPFCHLTLLSSCQEVLVWWVSRVAQTSCTAPV